MMDTRLFAAAAIAWTCMGGGATAQSPRVADRLSETLTTTVTLADIGLASGFRLANLGGRQELFVPLPQGVGATARELVLSLDDVSAHEARRSLEVLVNDRSAGAIALDGRAAARVVRVPLANTTTRDGFLKLTFLYSGAATQDRCVDVRYVGDSITVRPESAVEIDIPAAASFDIASLAALMPRDIAIALPQRRLTPSELAAALTIARALRSSGRRVAFAENIRPEIPRRGEIRRWSRGLILVGSFNDYSGLIDSPIAVVAGAVPSFGSINVVRSGGQPALLVSESDSARAARLFASPALAATRGSGGALVGNVTPTALPDDHVTLTDLGVAPAQADVFGRAELPFSIATRALPPGTRMARLVLDLMVAPDGAGENAVVTAFVNERLLGSRVAAVGEPTRLDLELPDGLVGAMANVRVVVQRRSAQGDCRFEPQGYPAQILGSSAVVLEPAAKPARDFSDLAAQWARGVEIVAPMTAADRPASVLGFLAPALAALSSDSTPVSVKLVDPAAIPAVERGFIAISDQPPAGSEPRVRFDRGRVAVADRAGRTVLELAGLQSGAVAQIVQAGEQSGLWIKPLAADKSLPSPRELRLDRGDVAFLDNAGLALAMSSERDQLVRIAYPDQVSWLSLAERYRSWMMGGLWLFATLAFLFALQRMSRRKSARGG